MFSFEVLDVPARFSSSHVHDVTKESAKRKYGKEENKKELIVEKPDFL